MRERPQSSNGFTIAPPEIQCMACTVPGYAATVLSAVAEKRRALWRKLRKAEKIMFFREKKGSYVSRVLIKVKINRRRENMFPYTVHNGPGICPRCDGAGLPQEPRKGGAVGNATSAPRSNNDEAQLFVWQSESCPPETYKRAKEPFHSNIFKCTTYVCRSKMFCTSVVQTTCMA
jgi:hypothetical protein